MAGKRTSVVKSSYPIQFSQKDDLVVPPMNSASANETPKMVIEQNLPSVSKAELIDMAMEDENGELNGEGARMLREMIEFGTVSDVLAALPKATHFTGKIVQELANLQQSLCRFQTPEDDLGFELIKLKFNLVFRNQALIKPWPSVCREG